MSEPIVPMLHDERKISAVWILSDPQQSGYRATEDQDLRVYPEPGEMAAVPWVAVIRNGEVVARLPARFCSIQYYPTQPHTHGNPYDPNCPRCQDLMDEAREVRADMEDE